MSRKLRKNTDNVNKKNENFYDILSIPSNPEDLFTLLYPIGKGAFGSVYKAIHNSTNKIYAIKIIDYSKNNNRENNNIINYNYQSIQQETSIMKLVYDSNYVVKYYGSYFSRKSNTLWLILEYCASGSVIDLMLSMNRTFSEIEVATIMEMVLKGLVDIHKKNLIHRDIKGANILLCEDGTAKIADFGVGVHLINEKSRNSKKGSPYWMSPQVALNNDYDEKTDIWSFGITCIEMINGEPPYSELKPRCVMEKIAKSPPVVEDLIDFEYHTDEFIDFAKKCLEINPVKRPTAKELLKHIFIVNFSKGKKYIIDLVQKHLKDVEIYRMKTLNNNYNNNNKKEQEQENEEEEEEEEEKDSNLFDNKSEVKFLDLQRDNSDFILNDNDTLKKSRTIQIFCNSKNDKKRKDEDKKEEKENEKEINTISEDKKIIDDKTNNIIINSCDDNNNNDNISNINNRNDLIIDQLDNDNIDENEEDNKFQTLITYDEEIKDNEIENKKNPDFINFIENDKFIYDDLKYLELMAKEKINNNNNINSKSNIVRKKSMNDKNNNNKNNDNKINYIINENKKIKEKKHNNSLQKSPQTAAYTKPQISYFKKKKISSSYNQRKDNRKMLTNDSFKIYDEILQKDNIDEKIYNNKPIKMNYHENNISTINKRYENNEENVKDSDDESTINQINHVKNYYYKTIQNYERGQSLKNKNNIFYQINTSNNYFINICNDNNNNNNNSTNTNTAREKTKFDKLIDHNNIRDNSEKKS